jgi:hypothetical protein
MSRKNLGIESLDSPDTRLLIPRNWLRFIFFFSFPRLAAHPHNDKGLSAPD